MTKENAAVLIKQAQKELLNMPLGKAGNNSEWTIRVAVEDGKPKIGDCLYDPSRVNVVVVDGIITEVLNIG